MSTGLSPCVLCLVVDSWFLDHHNNKCSLTTIKKLLTIAIAWKEAITLSSLASSMGRIQGQVRCSFHKYKIK